MQSPLDRLADAIAAESDLALRTETDGLQLLVSYPSAISAAYRTCRSASADARQMYGACGCTANRVRFTSDAFCGFDLPIGQPRPTPLPCQRPDPVPMARQPRLDLPGIPQHIVQRGNNRLPCFLDDGDRSRYRHLLRQALTATRCQLHAYVLMDNHVHLLITPPAMGAIGQLMQKLGRQYVGQFNARHRRTGTLWEGRYKSCLVDSTDYVLRCVRYIDLNPVRARITDDPTAFGWSSCAALCGMRADPLLTLHPAQRALGATEPERADAYRALLAEAISDEELASIRLYLQQQRAYGRDDFRAMVETKTQRFAGVRPAHRPARRPVATAG
ncbi:transposase [Lysobacter humi (ex Lee et al. 2017)]